MGACMMNCSTRPCFLRLIRREYVATGLQQLSIPLPTWLVDSNRARQDVAAPRHPPLPHRPPGQIQPTERTSEWIKVGGKVNLYRARNGVKRFFKKIKHYRRIASRYDKTAESNLAALKLVAVRIWLENKNSTS